MAKDDSDNTFHLTNPIDDAVVNLQPVVDNVFKLDLEYLFDDGDPVADVPFMVKSSDGTLLQKGTLSKSGTAELSNLPAGDYDIEYGNEEDEKQLAEAKKELKKYFDDIIADLKTRAKQREEELKKKEWYQKGWHYTLLFLEGVYDAGKDLVVLAIDIATIPYKIRAEAFKILIAPGGVEGKIDKLKEKIEGVVEYGEESYKTMEEFYDTYQILATDNTEPKIIDMIQDFAVEYAENLTAEDYTAMAGDVVFTLIVALLTAGAGAAAGVATKIPKFLAAAKKIKQITALLKKLKFRKKFKGKHTSKKVSTTTTKPKKKKADEKDKKKCKRKGCKKGYSKFCPYSEPARARPEQGENVGDSIGLRDNMWGSDPGQKDHPWWTGSRSLQAHHLIPSEAMKQWKKLCDNFGYDINSKMNGVMLPNQLDLACHLGVPLHRGNHAKTFPKYPIVTKKMIQVVQKNVNMGKYCGVNGHAKFEADLNKLSKRICRKVSSFAWKLTDDGDDYQPGMTRGCGDRTKVGTKQNDCSHERKHNFTHELSGKKIRSYKEGKRWTLKVNDGHLR